MPDHKNNSDINLKKNNLSEKYGIIKTHMKLIIIIRLMADHVIHAGSPRVCATLISFFIKNVEKHQALVLPYIVQENLHPSV